MTVRALRSTAQRIQALAGEAADLRAELERLVVAVAPWLLELAGVGPISAAQVLVSWSHAGRLRSEGAFAAVAGVNPIPASSGQVVRPRLNRSGDRPISRAYAARRRAEGRSVRDIRRCLKRAIARQLFKPLERCDRSTVELLRIAWRHGRPHRSVVIDQLEHGRHRVACRPGAAASDAPACP
jgi:transposase